MRYCLFAIFICGNLIESTSFFRELWSRPASSITSIILLRLFLHLLFLCVPSESYPCFASVEDLFYRLECDRKPDWYVGIFQNFSLSFINPKQNRTWQARVDKTAVKLHSLWIHDKIFSSWSHIQLDVQSVCELGDALYLLWKLGISTSSQIRQVQRMPKWCRKSKFRCWEVDNSFSPIQIYVWDRCQAAAGDLWSLKWAGFYLLF